ncbi:MAG: hypothetical protein RIT45_2159 [Pseudomonadota bacterium]
MQADGDQCIADGSCIGGNNTCKCSTTADCAVHEEVMSRQVVFEAIASS